MPKEEYTPPRWVKAGEHGWINLEKEDYQFEDISEDIYGKDVLAFTYKEKLYHSNVVIGVVPSPELTTYPQPS